MGYKINKIYILKTYDTYSIKYHLRMDASSCVQRNSIATEIIISLKYIFTILIGLEWCTGKEQTL